jgi:hypothetical protein
LKVINLKIYKGVDFLKILTINDFFNHFAKFEKKTLLKPHLDASQKNYFFCDVTKVENFDEKSTTSSTKNQKSPFEHFRSGRKGREKVNDDYNANE